MYCEVPQIIQNRTQHQLDRPVKAGGDIWALIMLGLQRPCFVREAVPGGGGAVVPWLCPLVAPAGLPTVWFTVGPVTCLPLSLVYLKNGKED